MTEDWIIEADADCEHLDFDIQGRCVRCGRDFAERRANGHKSAAEIERESCAQSPCRCDACIANSAEMVAALSPTVNA